MADNKHLVEAYKALEEGRAKIDAAKAEERDLTAEEQKFVDDALDAVEAAEAAAKAEEREAKVAAILDANDRQAQALEDANKEAASKAGILLPSSVMDKKDKRDGVDSPEYAKALSAYIRGDESTALKDYMWAETKAAAAEGADGTGGYLVPQVLWDSLWVDASAGFPLIDEVTTYSSSDGYKLYIDQAFSHGTFTEVTEAGTPAASDETYTQVVITAYKGQRISKLSDEVISDSRFDIVGHLTSMLARQAAEWQNARLTTGSGSSQAKGIVTFLAADATNDQTIASSSTVTPDELLTTLHAVGPQYRNRAKWMLHDDTGRVLRTLKDANGVSVWAQSLTVGNPNTLYGYPVLLNPDMATFASAAKVIVFGDLSNHVRFVPNDGQLQIKRLDELYAGTGQVGIRATQRFGSDWGGPPDAGGIIIAAT